MASLNDKITDVRNAARPNSARVITARNIDGTNLACNDLSGWPTTSKVHFVVYQIDTNENPIPNTQIDCYGIVSGNTITQMVVVDGTDGGNSIGDVVEMLPTAAWAQDLADGLSTSLERTGELKANTVGTSQLQTNAVTSAKITDSSVTTAKINDSAVTTEKINDDAVTSAKLAPTKSTDANGWTVRDYGTWKTYERTFTISGLYVVNAQRAIAVSGGSLPVGVSTLANVRSYVSWQGSVYGGHVLLGINGDNNATNLTIMAGNQYAGALNFTGNIHCMLVDV